LFRDKKVAGVVRRPRPALRASRHVPLEWGRFEEEWLRCCYHLWLTPYDTDAGPVPRHPCETEESARAIEVWQPAYPTTESGGPSSLYGPAPEPLFVLHAFDIIRKPTWNSPQEGRRVSYCSAGLWATTERVGMVPGLLCNLAAHWRTFVDPYHLFDSGPVDQRRAFDGR